MTTYLVEYQEKIIGSYNNYSNAKTFILSCLQNNFMKEYALIHCLISNSCYKKKTITIKLNNTKKNKQNLRDTSYSDDTTYSNSSYDSYESSSCNGTSVSTSNTANTTNTNRTSNTNRTANTANTANTNDANRLNSTIKLQKVDEKEKILDYNNPAILEMAKQKIELQHKINMLKIKKEKIEESKSVYDNDLKLFNIFKESRQTDKSFIIPELFANKFEVMDKLFNANNLSWENFITNYQHDNNYGDYFSTNSYEDMFIGITCEETKEDTICEEVDINSDSD